MFESLITDRALEAMVVGYAEDGTPFVNLYSIQGTEVSRPTGTGAGGAVLLPAAGLSVAVGRPYCGSGNKSGQLLMVPLIMWATPYLLACYHCDTRVWFIAG